MQILDKPEKLRSVVLGTRSEIEIRLDASRLTSKIGDICWNYLAKEEVSTRTSERDSSTYPRSILWNELKTLIHFSHLLHRVARAYSHSVRLFKHNNFWTPLSFVTTFEDPHQPRLHLRKNQRLSLASKYLVLAFGLAVFVLSWLLKKLINLSLISLLRSCDAIIRKTARPTNV